jgi:hypothetical protein
LRFITGMRVVVGEPGRRAPPHRPVGYRSAGGAQKAVILNAVEAASRAPGGVRREGSYLPERFEPTVAAGSTELFTA